MPVSSDRIVIAWVTRIFSNATNLTQVRTTALEIRRLVQAFLNARQTAMPASQRHPVVAPRAEDSQESQEDYGTFDLDLNDPELQAALGDDMESSIANQNKVKDGLVSQVGCVLLGEVIFLGLTHPRSSLSISRRQSFVWFANTSKISLTPSPLKNIAKMPINGLTVG